jgi:hypothetical protein
VWLRGQRYGRPKCSAPHAIQRYRLPWMSNKRDGQDGAIAFHAVREKPREVRCTTPQVNRGTRMWRSYDAI